MATLYNTTMGQVNFNSRLDMVDGLVNIDGMLMPMDFIQYLPLNVDFEYYCNYGTYVENGTFRLTSSTTNILFPINTLEYNEEIELVELNINVDDPNAIISIYPVQLLDIIGDSNMDLLPKIEVINGKAMVPEYGMWIIMVDIEGKASTTKRIETNGDDIEIDIGTGKETGGDEIETKSHLQVNVSPITATVELKINGVWISSPNNYFENINTGQYNLRASNTGYITTERIVNITSGTNNISINLIKENSDGSEIIIEPDGSLPPVSYNELYINNISNFKFIRVIPLTNVNDTSVIEYEICNDGINDILGEAQYNSKYVDVDMDTGKIIFKNSYGSIWMIEAIPVDNIKYYKSTIYVDLHEMNYRYIDIELIEREEKYNFKCSISNPGDCDRFYKYGISYESADMQLDSGIISTANVDEEIQIRIPSGTYTIIATLYDNDGTTVKVPVTPENFTPYEDIDLQFKYNKHIKIKLNMDLSFSYNNKLAIDISHDNATKLLDSNIYEQYGYDSTAHNTTFGNINNNISDIDINEELELYIKPNNGVLKCIVTSYSSTASSHSSSSAFMCVISGVSDGSIIDISQYATNRLNDREILHGSKFYKNVFRYTPFKYTHGNTSYYSNKFNIYEKDKFILYSSITEGNVHSYLINYNVCDAKYILSSSTVAVSGSNSISYGGQVLLHDEVVPIFPDNKRNVKIYTNLPDADIVVYDINSSLYRGISRTNSFSGNSKIYRGKGTFDMDVLNNCVYSATIYRSGYAIKTFSFSVAGDNVIINKDLDLLSEWNNNIPSHNEVISSRSDIKFHMESGSSVDVVSIEPLYPGMVISGDGISNVPSDKKYRIKMIYNPPKNKVINNPVDLIVGGTDINPFLVPDKETILSIHENTGIEPIKSKISIDMSNSPNLNNKRVVIYHNKNKKSINLNTLPQTVDIFGYSNDMYLELYDGDTLISKNMFFLSKEYSDIVIKVPKKNKTSIKIIPRNNMRNNMFIAWEEKDPYIAPYYDTGNMNQYTKYNKISNNEEIIVDNLYGSIGDVLQYKLFIDGYYPYEGSVTISNDTIINLNSITLPNRGNAFKYFAIDSPNMEYVNTVHFNKYTIRVVDQNNPVSYPYESTIQEGPIMMKLGSNRNLWYNIKYNIPMFMANNNEFDIMYEFLLFSYNSTNNSIVDGVAKLYHDNDRPNANEYLKTSTFATGSYPATNGKYPFVSTVGGLLPTSISTYCSHIPHFNIYRYPQHRGYSVTPYLYTGRYKYFHNTSYNSLYNYNSEYDMKNNSIDNVIYSIGDVLIKREVNIITTDTLNDENLRKNDYVNVLSISTNETEMVQRTTGDTFYWNRRLSKGSNLQSENKSNNAVKLSGHSIVYSKEKVISVPEIINNGKDVIIAHDISTFISNTKRHETRFINLSNGTIKNQYIEFPGLSNSDPETILYDMDMMDIIFLSTNDNGYINRLSDREYAPLRLANTPSVPLYYKVPHGDIVMIYGDSSHKNIIRNGAVYKTNSVNIESPIPYGISYSQSALNKTILSLDGGYGSDSIVVSGTFPMKINIQVILRCKPEYNNRNVGPDVLVKGYITLNKNNLSVDEYGIYSYVYSYDDITIESTKTASDIYSGFIYDIDGRALSGEYDFEILKSNDYPEITDGNMAYTTVGFQKVNFDNEYILRVHNDDAPGYMPVDHILFRARYIDKSTMLAYAPKNPVLYLGIDWISNMGSSISALYQDIQQELYDKDKNVNTGILGVSNVSFTNTDNVEGIYLMRNIGQFTRLMYELDNPARILYGVHQIMISYSDNYKYMMMVYIDSPNTTIELSKLPEIPSTNIDVGRYDFRTNINFNEYWTIEVDGDYRFTSKYTTAPVGTYKYVARCYGYKSIHGTMEITKNSTTYIDLEFEKEDVLEYGTVNFRVSPTDADIYVQNNNGEYMRIRSDKMSLYLPFGSYKYIAKNQYYQDYNGTVVVDKDNITVNITLTVKPRPTYLVSFNIINPRHGVTTKFSINNGDWFEGNEIVVNEYDTVSWSAEAVGFEPTGGTFGAYKDTTINIDLSRGSGTLYIENIPRFMRFRLQVTDSDGATYWREPFMNYVYLNIDKKEYNYEIVYTGDQEVKTHQERSGVLNHLDNITTFDASCELAYGYLNVSSVNIPEYDLELSEAIYPFKEHPVSLGSIQLPANKYRISCIPKGNSDQYFVKSQEFILNGGETKDVSFIYDTNDIKKYSIRLSIYPGQVPYKEYKIEIYTNGTWSTIDTHILPEKTTGDTTRVRISRAGYITQDITVTHGISSIIKEVHMEEKLEGGYLYPLYKNDFNTFSNASSTSMIVSDINKNKDFYTNYNGMRFDGTRFGKLPATVYPGDYVQNPQRYFDKFHPIIIRMRPKSGPSNHYPIIINEDRRESFIIAAPPTNTNIALFSRIEIQGGDGILYLPPWELSNSLYTVNFITKSHHMNSSLKTSHTSIESEKSYILSHTNSTGLRLSTSNLSQAVTYSLRINIERHDKISMFFGETLPTTVYNYSKTNNKKLRIAPTWRDNSFWYINFGAYNVLNGNIYFYLENTGNIISEQIGGPVSKRWMKWGHEASWNMVEVNRYYYLLRQGSPTDTSIRIKYVYMEDGVEPHVGYMNVPTKAYPTTSHFPEPGGNHYLMVTNDIMQDSLLEFQRNNINDPVTVSFGIDDSYDSIERYMSYKIYNITPNGMDGGDPIDSHPILNEDVSGLTLQFERGTVLSIEATGIVNSTFLVELNKDITNVNIYDHYMDKDENNIYGSELDLFGGKNGSDNNKVKIKFNISKFNPSKPNVPDQNLKLDEFDEIIVMASTYCRHVRGGDENPRYFIYRETPRNNNIMVFSQTSIIRDYTITFRKKGYNTILQPLSVYLANRDINSTPIEVALPTLHPVTE